MKLRIITKKVRLLFSLFLFFSAVVVTAQTTKTITGTVFSSEDNMSLPGATVVVKGGTLTIGTSTDMDGLFELEVPVDATTLVVSFIGFQSQEVLITDGPINVVLDVEANTLNEFVVVGYGVQKVSKVSGAISRVGKKSIENLSPVRAEESLQGSASGVNVISGGSPGATPTVIIRGVSSNTGNNPLVVVDGILLDGYSRVSTLLKYGEDTTYAYVA